MQFEGKVVGEALPASDIREACGIARVIVDVDWGLIREFSEGDEERVDLSGVCSG